MAYLGNGPGVASQRVVTSFTATSGQTTFVPSSGYTLGYIDVFVNGVKLINGSDYTASNGVNIVLATAASADDTVEAVAYFPRGLSDGYTKAEADARYLQPTSDGSSLTGINTDLVSDTTPQLGGDLDGNGNTIDLTGNTSYFGMPRGTTAQRPASPSAGYVRFNTTLDQLEQYTSGSGWQGISAPPTISSTDISNVEESDTTQTIVITGQNFDSTATAVLVDANGATVTPTTSTRNSSSQITVTFSGSDTLDSTTSDPLDIKVTNGSGLSAVLADQITVDARPTWSTTAGSLGTVIEDQAISSITLSATDPEGETVSYSIASGALPTGLTLSSGGVITGTPNVNDTYSSSGVTHSFSVAASDGTGNTTNRAFSILRKWADGSASNLYTTPHFLRNTLGVTTDGTYWVKTAEMANPIETYINFGLVDSKDWVLMMHLNQNNSQSGSLVGSDHINKDIPWKGFNLEKDSTYYYSYFSSYQSYNTRSTQSTTSGGNMGGMYVFLGQAGGHGFYATNQAPCSWSTANGAVGAGYDGSCGSYPTTLRMGFGSSGGPNYSLSTGQWKSWVWMDTKLPG